MSRIFEITDKVLSYHPKADIDLINRAYVFAAQAHANQKRSSGEPYFTHPLAVAGILASLRLDEASIVTGLLHDTVEDTDVTLDEIRERFGDEIAQLVDGVTKIGKLKFQSSEQKQAENFRKLILATARDLRVLLVKLADRLHNMRTLCFLPEHKRRVISEETVQLYAPLAHRLGIHWIRQEMEDLAFSHLEPEASRELAERLAEHLDSLKDTCMRLELILQEVLDRQGVKARVQGRMKHMYSLYDKMQRKHVSFDEVYDLVAFRVIVEDTPTCYQTLGIIHSLYRPVPGRFKDYIALPKPNGYQSLHTSVYGPENYLIEVQVRTEAMHRYAEDGIAAHWMYKEGKDATSGDLHKFRWLKQLTELLQEADNPVEYLENARLDLFVQEVYVFSRDGDIFSLPRGSMPLDFAYAVHTDVGNHCIGVRINGEPADLGTVLHNGDQIEVLTSPEQTPSRQWHQYVCTPRARQAIRQWFRRQEREASQRMGAEMLREVLGSRAKPDKAMLKKLECESIEVLEERLGHGDIPVERLLDVAKRTLSGPLHFARLSQNLMQAADCCLPLPGDPVLGRFQPGRGMIVHHRDCAEVVKTRQDAWLDVKWCGETGQLYPTAIEVRTRNERGMLARVSGCIAENDANIEDVKIHQFEGAMTKLSILVEVSDRTHLAAVLRAVKRLPGVTNVSRRTQGGLPARRHSRKGLGAAIRQMVARGWPRQPSESKA